MISTRICVALLALAAALLAGCNPAAKAIGKWEVETDKLKLQLPAHGDNVAAAMLGSMSLFVQIRADLELKADQTWTCEFGAAGNVQSEAPKPPLGGSVLTLRSAHRIGPSPGRDPGRQRGRRSGTVVCAKRPSQEPSGFIT